MTERNTRIRASQIINIAPIDFDATNSPTNNQVAKYDSSTGKFTWTDQTGGGGSGSSYTTSFTNANLSSGILAVTHNLGVTYPVVIIYDENDNVIESDEITYSTTNEIAIDLSSFGTISGTWNVRVGTGGGGGATSLEEMTDVSFDSGTPTDNQVLQYNASEGKWKAETLVSTSVYRDSFIDSDLATGDILIVTHSLGQKYVVVAVYNNSDKQIIPDDVTLDSTTQLTIDLSSFAPLTGTWNIVVMA